MRGRFRWWSMKSLQRLPITTLRTTDRPNNHDLGRLHERDCDCLRDGYHVVRHNETRLFLLRRVSANAFSGPSGSNTVQVRFLSWASDDFATSGKLRQTPAMQGFFRFQRDSLGGNPLTLRPSLARSVIPRAVSQRVAQSDSGHTLSLSQLLDFLLRCVGASAARACRSRSKSAAAVS